MHNHSLRFVIRQLQEAKETIQAAKKLWLTGDLSHENAVKVGDQISLTEILILNALDSLPELPAPVRDAHPLESEQAQLASSAYYSPVFWQGQLAKGQKSNDEL